MDLNRATLIGHVGKDPEFHDMTGGKQLCKFTLATSRKWRQDGELREETAWHNIVVFNPYIVDAIAKMVQKGTKIFLEGEIKPRKYEQDGVTKWITEIIVPQVVGQMIVLGNARPRDAVPTQQPSDYPSESRGQFTADKFDDDIPF